MRSLLSPYKIINIILLVVVTLVWFSITYYYSSGLCLSQNCTFEFRNGFLNPTQTAAFYLLPTLAVFLILPSHYFRRWLWYIASWALPLAVYLTAGQSVYTTALFSSRTFFAQATMQMLFIITMIFIAGVWLAVRYVPRLRDAI